MRRLLVLLCCAAAMPSVLGACGSGGGAGGTTTTGRRAAGTIQVPRDAPTIQEAVDRAVPGDLILVAAGTYNESVNVETERLVIRGVDRNTVILDGGDAKENGLAVFADGVAVENLTLRRYRSNGVLFTGDYGKGRTLSGYRVRYVTAYNNGLYGIYAFNATRGLIERTYTSGHPDAGIYVGQCNPCDVVVRDNLAERNAVGYQGTNAGGDTYVVGNTFRANRVGVEATSSNKEQLAPQRTAVIAANAIVDNADPLAPQATEAFGYGVAIGGGHDNLVTRNRISGNPAAGIALAPKETFFPESNRVEENQLSGNGVDLAYISADGRPLGNCFRGNRFTTSGPADIERLLACAPEAQGGGGLPAAVAGPPPTDYRTVPAPGPQPSMPDPAGTPAEPATAAPPAVDVAGLRAPDPGRFPGAS